MQLQKIGTLFTDEHHQIIFMDDVLQSELSITKETVGRILGTPVYNLFGFTLAEYQKFLEQYIRLDTSEEVNLDIITKDGNVIPSIVVGILNLDAHNNMMGVDYRIQPTSDFVVPLNVNKANDPLIDEMLQIYFKQQMERLYTTTVDWGGKRLGSYLNTIINETSQNNNWGIEMSESQVHLPASVQLIDVYLGLLVKASTYISSIIGAKLVHKQIEAVNEETNTLTFAHIDRYWFKNIND